MAYQVLARKWRPKSFASLKGQGHVTRALMNALARGELHHAYLFTGTRGVGKTSIARILAKCLNCEQGVCAEPCGKCAACTSIDAGHFADLIEVDAASRTRVEDTRELLDNVQYAPALGRFKIYLIDEVHMLSGHSFNALLKTLEEPPPHVKFILATTDPERIPVTVLSRCLRFVLKTLSQAEMSAQLAQILQVENISYEERALNIIAKAATGSMRDALSVLEQGIAYCNGALKTDLIEEMLGLSYQRYIPALISALSQTDVKRCLQLVEEMAAMGADFAQSLGSLLQIFHAFAIAQAVDADEGLEIFADIPPELFDLKDKFAPEEVQLFYQIGLLGQKDLPFAPSPRTGFEMTLVRMMVFNPTTSLTNNDEPQQAILKPKQVVAVTQPSPSPSSSSSSSQNPPVECSVKETMPLDLDWVEITNKLPLSGLTLMLVKNCEVLRFDGKTLTLMLDASQKACLNAQRQAQIQEVLSQYFAKSIKLSITVGELKGASPLQIEQQKILQRENQAKVAIEQDPVVKNIISTFGATVEKITVNDDS
ncbi:MAG: DNA polymerase III subunit gamma/tau [Proteobacteria bacterium]|nr:DNA polymerase III subunit gamma/tau [Pseudomonadota bacterium]